MGGWVGGYLEKGVGGVVVVEVEEGGDREGVVNGGEKLSHPELQLEVQEGFEAGEEGGWDGFVEEFAEEEFGGLGHDDVVLRPEDLGRGWVGGWVWVGFGWGRVARFGVGGWVSGEAHVRTWLVSCILSWYQKR